MPDQIAVAALRKVRWRLIPFLFLLYIVAYLDRVNVGFASIDMNRDLNFSATVYGLGSGIFFLSYTLLEVPSNLVLARVGARLWIARIMFTWGALSTAMIFVDTPASFYVIRFLLGAAEAGFFPVDELRTLRKIDSRLQGHPVLGATPGIEASTGSLGQGLSIGLGMALAARLDGKDFRVFVMLGDGECQEGQVWEAAMAAGHHAPDNLIAIVDYNKFQLDGATSEILGIEPFAEKWKAFGWDVREIDGHDLGEVMDALDWTLNATGPVCIIAHTVKGKGVSFMEGENAYHGVAPTEEELAKALGELDDTLHRAEASIERSAAHDLKEGR